MASNRIDSVAWHDVVYYPEVVAVCIGEVEGIECVTFGGRVPSFIGADFAKLWGKHGFGDQPQISARQDFGCRPDTDGCPSDFGFGHFWKRRASIGFGGGKSLVGRGGNGMATGLKDWRGRQQRTYGERGTMREGRHSQPRVDIPLAKQPGMDIWLWLSPDLDFGFKLCVFKLFWIGLLGMQNTNHQQNIVIGFFKKKIVEIHPKYSNSLIFNFSTLYFIIFPPIQDVKNVLPN